MALTKVYVKKVFSLLEEGRLDDYLEQYVDEQVQWTITGTNVLSGLYTSRQDFVDRAIATVKSSLVGGIKMKIPHIYVDGDTAIVEMEAIATAKRGHAYSNQYVWIQRFKEGKIVEARVYYDDVLVDKTMKELSYEYHHTGIPTTEPKANERYSSTFKMYTTPGDNEFRIQWHRFEEGCPLHPLVQTVPHVAFKVASIDEAIVGRKVILEPYYPFEGFRVVMVEIDGAPVELIETNLSEEEIGVKVIRVL